MAEASDIETGEARDWFARTMASVRNLAAGSALCAGGLFVLVAALTYDPADPSLNTAADGSALSNAMGHAGAVIGDATLQWFGWAGVVLAVMAFAWGGMMLMAGPKPRGPKLTAIRVLAATLATLGLAAAAASLPIPSTWPLATGLGGAAGDVLHAEIASFLDAIHAPAVNALAGVLALAAGVAGVFAAYGVTPRDLADAWEALRRLFARIARRATGWRETYIDGMDTGVARLEPVHAGVPAKIIEDHAPARPARAKVAAPEPEILEAELVEDDEPVEPVTAPKPKAARPARVSVPAPSAPAKTKRTAPPQPSEFTLPAINLLTDAPDRTFDNDEELLEQQADDLETVLMDFSVKGQVVNVRPGPVVTLFEFEPAPGVKSSRVIGLADDIARSMSAVSARVAVVPGRNAIGIELPNRTRETVFLSSLLNAPGYNDAKTTLPLALGETIGGEPFIADLARMPHLLIAGTTGSGKSVGINAMILSLMYRLPPERCRFIMIDPKMLELSIYDGCPHLLSPVVTDPKKAVAALKWVVREMENRYRTMSSAGVRNIAGFNRRVEDAAKKGERLEKEVKIGTDPDTGEPITEMQAIAEGPLPYLVVVIDEMADLMLVAGKEIEAAVQRLAQMARAAGIHLITATQRPSVDVITGTIKANFPTRISFQVTSKVDSRTILGEQGAEQLLGQGDLLYMQPGGRIRRLHGPFVSDEEVETVASFLKEQGEPEYVDGITDGAEEDTGDMLAILTGEDGGGAGDDLFDQAVAIVTADRRASTSYLQRRLKIGYNRAASLMEQLEDQGVVSQANAAGKREVLAGPPPEI